MALGRGLVALAFVATVLGGCVEGGADSDTPPISSHAAPATASEETGGMEGQITNDELMPIVGATVALVEKDLQTKTAADGRYSFSELAPGEYSLVVQALGYESVTKRVSIVAGEVLEASYVLVAIVLIDERQQSYEYKGFLGVGVVTPLVRIPTWIICNDTGLLCEMDRLNFETNVTEGVATVVDVLVWDSSAPGTAKTLSIRVRPDDKDSQTTQGRSPVLNRYEEPKVKKIIGHRVSTPFTSTNPDEAVQLYYQQTFTIYSTIFWGVPAPADYSPLPK